MTKIKFFVAFVAIMMSVSFAKADVYSDGLKKMMDAGVSAVDIQSMQKMIPGGMGGALSQDTQSKMVETIAPYYRQNMSEAEFTQMVDYCTKPEIISVAKEFATSMANPQKLQQELLPAIMTMSQGGTPENLKQKDCDPKLLEKINQYLDLFEVNKLQKSMFSTLRNVISTQIPNAAENQQAMGMMNKIFDFLGNNITTIFVNNLITSASADQLDTINAIAQQPFYPSMKKANTALINDFPNLLTQIFANTPKP